MTDAREQAIQGAFSAFNESGPEGLAGHFDDDFVLTTPPELASEPGTYTGHDGVRRYFDSFYEAMDEIRIEPSGRFSHAGDWTAAELNVHFKGKASGLEGTQVVTAIFRFDQERLAEQTFSPSWDEGVAEIDRRAV